MAYFEWADDLVIDRGVIDADHQKLVATVNELHSATTALRWSLTCSTPCCATPTNTSGAKKA